jgi:hypothetical protein
MNDRSELVAASLLALYLYLAISIADWLLLAPSLVGLLIAAWFRLRGAPIDSGYDRA